MIKLLYFRVILIILSIISTTTLLSQVIENPYAPGFVCSNQSIRNGIHEQELTDISVRSICATGYTKRMRFILVQIRSGSTFTFQITPSSGSPFDYDFLSWKNPPLDINNLNNINAATINSLPRADRGNRNTGNQGRTVGLRFNAPTLCRGVEGDGLERHYDVVPGDIILIGIDKFGTGIGSVNESFTIDFGGDSVLDCYLGKSFYECIDEQTGLATFNLSSFTNEIRPPNDNSAVFFYRTEAQAQAHSVENQLENIVSIPYSQDGMEVFASFAVANLSGEIEIKVVKFILRPLRPLNEIKPKIYGCYTGTNPGTGAVLGQFNLNELFLPAYLTDTFISKKIYTSLANANANGTAGLIPQANWATYNSAARTVYVRLEYNTGDVTCVNVIPVILDIVRVQVAQSVVNQSVCYGELIDLTQFQTRFVPEANDYTYSYYIGNNLLTNPSEFTVSETRAITVKIGKGSCIETVTINLNMEVSPYIEFWSNFMMCDSDFDGVYEVNLPEIRDFLTDNTGVYNYSFYLSLADATNQVNAIAGDIALIQGGQKLFVRANSAGRCYSVEEVPLQVGDQISFTESTTLLEECVNEDGTFTFDLTAYIPSLALDTSVTYKFYPTLADAGARTNELTNPQAWITSLQEGTAYVLLSQVGKCELALPIHFKGIQKPTIEILPSALICEGENYILDLTAYTEYTFNVSGAATILRDKVYSLSTAGNYAVTVTNSKGCQATYQFELSIAILPIFTPFSEIALCDENFDGLYEINLTEIRAIAQANVGIGFGIKLFKSEEDAIAGTNELVTDQITFSVLPAKIWVKANTAAGNCYIIRPISFVKNQLVSFTATTQVLEICATPTENQTFDLTSMLMHLNLTTGTNVSYFVSQEDANNNRNAIGNPLAWHPLAASGTIYVRLSKDGICSAVTSFNYLVNALPVLTIANNPAICEGGEYILDLSSYTGYTFVITGGTYETIAPKKYKFTTAGTYEVIAKNAKGCTALFTFNLVVNPLPKFTSIKTFDVCDSNVDGFYELNLSALSDVVLINNTGITLSYFKTEADLLAGRNAIVGTEYLTRLPATIWVKAVTASGCFDHISISLVQGNSISVQAARLPLQVCKQADGSAEFDLTLIRSQYNVPDGYILSYYKSLADLQRGVNEILNPTRWVTTTNTGTLYVKFEAAGLCPGYSSFQYKANVLPVISLDDKYYICDGSEYILDLSRYNYTIQITGNTAVSLGNNKFRISTLGLYNVTATNEFGCSTSHSFELATFDPPAVREIVIGSSTITVRLAPNAEYVNVQYSLDGINFQASNVLNIPQRGVNYDIYVKIANCIYLIQNVQVVQIPTFFSPNNDGSNDVWRIKPIQLNQEVDLKIFDRFGKTIFEQIGSQDIIWDGKLNGKPLPSTDYWFTIDIKGLGPVQAIKYTGSITLKNKN